MKVVAFLQNMWVIDPAKAERQIARDQTGKLRARLIRYGLFAGCASGRRLRRALGSEWCERIIWEEASPVIAAHPHEYCPPEPEHIKAVLAKYQPDVVLCFTRAGEDVVRACVAGRCPVVAGPHPAARGGYVGEELLKVREELDGIANGKLPIVEVRQA